MSIRSNAQFIIILKDSMFQNHSKLNSLFILFFILISLSYHSTSYSFFQVENAETSDTSNVSDTSKLNTITTDTNKIDTTHIYKTYHNIGKILECVDTLAFYKIPTINYYTLSDILIQKMSLYPLNTGISGNGVAFSNFGALPSENSLSLNNVPMIDLYENSNFNAISPEFINNVEILYGSKSAIIAGKSGITLNIQPSLFDTKKPYTRLWYVQGDNKLIGVDGVYSQNFLPNWNITAGFRRLSANSYYTNSFFDSWNARIALRKNISELSAISLLYHFTNYNIGDFGGILFSDYNTNNNQATLTRSNFAGLSSRQYRTDVMLSYSAITNDSNFYTNSNTFFNHNEEQIIFRTQKELLELDSSGRNIANVANFGINTLNKIILSNTFNIGFGGELSYLNLPKTLISKEYEGINYNAWGNINTKLDIFKLFTGIRFGSKYGKKLISAGANIETNISSKMTIYADASLSEGEPLPVFDFKNETHLLGIIGGKYSDTNTFIDVKLFFRNNNNMLKLQFQDSNIFSFNPVLSDITSRQTMGLNAKIGFHFLKSFECKLSLQNFYESTDSNAFTPKFYFNGKVQYTYSKGTSKISGGLEGSVLLNSRKLYYNPLFKHYSEVEMDSSIEADGLTAFISTKFGNAFVRASFKNIIGTNFSYMAYYPIQKRELCLSLTWAFPN